jgi:hypothetical protein
MLDRRAFIVLLPLVAAGCGGGDPLPTRGSFPPLSYGYLTPLRLNVASIEEAAPPPPGPLDDINPAPPAQALLRMAQDRLAAGGTLGRAVFSIDEASIIRRGGGLNGVLAVHLDVLTSEGSRAGFAEARVSRRVDGIGDLRSALYDITVQMMQDMNIEFEFQVRQSLRDWLQEATTAPPPAAVEQQQLGAPSRPTP